MDSPLTFQSVQLHFVYSFLVSPGDLLDPQGHRGLRKVRTSYARGDCADGVRDYLEPYLHLPMERVEGRFRTIPRGALRIEKTDTATDRGEFDDVTLSAWTQIFASGWGSVRYVLTIQPSNSVGLARDQIVGLANLGLRREPFAPDSKPVCPFRLVQKGDQGELTLFDSFRNDAESLATDPKLGLASPFFWDRKQDPSSCEQYPFPIIICQSGHQFGRLFPRDEENTDHACATERGQLHRDLLTLLLRTIEFDPDLTFAARHLGFEASRLPNLCSTRKVFLQMYIRSALAVAEDLGLTPENDEPSAQPCSYIIPCFVQTVQSLLMRWYAAAVLNQRLERAILDLSAARDVRGLIDQLERAATLRRLVASTLADPVTYRFGSGSLTKLYGVGVHTFRIREIELLLTERLTMLDKLLQDYGYLIRSGR